MHFRRFGTTGTKMVVYALANLSHSPHSPHCEGSLHRRTTVIVRQDRSYVDREKVSPNQDKQRKGKHSEREDGPPDRAEQKFATDDVGLHSSQVVLLLRLYIDDTRIVVVRGQRGLGLCIRSKHHHCRRVGGVCVWQTRKARRNSSRSFRRSWRSQVGGGVFR